MQCNAMTLPQRGVQGGVTICLVEGGVTIYLVGAVASRLAGCEAVGCEDDVTGSLSGHNYKIATDDATRH